MMDWMQSTALETRRDALLTSAIRDGPEEPLRRARLVVSGATLISVLGILAGTIHTTLGNPTRAAIPLAMVPLGAFVIWLVRRLGSTEVAVHIICVSGSIAMVASPVMGETDTPLLIGLIMLPFAACVMGGIRAGIIWTIVVTTFLVFWSIWIPFEGEERTLAWLTVISTASVGLGAVIVERSREQSEELKQQAIEEARRQGDERVKAERALNRTRALFEAAFEHAPSILIVASLDDGRILDVNESFVRTSGWSAEEAIGKTLGELQVWSSEEDRQLLLKQAMSNGVIDSVEIRLRAKTGGQVWLLAGAETLEVDGGRYLLAQGIEISERKRAENEVIRYREELEARFAERGDQLRASIERMKNQDRLSAVGTLASGIAHQINNPIGGIVAAAEFALSAGGESDGAVVQERALTTILNEAQRCGRIVKNMLKFARNEQTAKWMNDLNLIVRGAAEAVRGDVEQRGGRLHLRLKHDPIQVHSSPIDLEQVVVNLIRNAAESKPAGVNVHVSASLDGGQAILEVADDGSGFSNEAREHAFDPFFTSRMQQGGSGLGLSIVHGIVKDHGGEIDICGGDPNGATIRIRLPIADKQQA